MKEIQKTEKKRNRTKPILLTILLLTIVGCFVLYKFIFNVSAFQTLQKHGYSGTEEQWLVSLVGETVDKTAESAYELACQNDYAADYETWTEILTGTRTTNTADSMYELACQNGYQGTLQEWLQSLSQNPDKLGKSKGTQEKTEYELACDFGYEGTFIEWIVSVAYDRIPD